MVKIKESISPNGEVVHYGVGAVIERDGKYLLIERALKPEGFGGISEHINEGESPEQALVRGVEEEAGLKVVNYKLIYETDVKSDRSCGKGKIKHHCYVYDCEIEGEIEGNPREVKSVGWYGKEQIKNLDLESLWKVFFKKMKIID